MLLIINKIAAGKKGIPKALAAIGRTIGAAFFGVDLPAPVLGGGQF